jgi:hypothetical protein
MKAVDLYLKYRGALLSTERNVYLKAVEDLVAELMEDANRIMKIRNVATVGGLDAAMREQNDKWNAIVKLFVKKDGTSPIERNVIRTAIAEAKASVIPDHPVKVKPIMSDDEPHQILHREDPYYPDVECDLRGIRCHGLNGKIVVAGEPGIPGV